MKVVILRDSRGTSLSERARLEPDFLP